MYKFIDVHEVSDGVVHLPSEALMINGEYIENQISGYRTLSVSGREALSPDVVTYTTGVRDGSRVKSKRFPERIITVNYQLIAESNEAFREAYNKLAAILNVEDAELIFNDEQDKFFVGTPCTIDTVQPGRNAVTGSFEILCADPFKYSVMEYEAETQLDGGSLLIDYGGTYKAYPKLRAEFYDEDEISEDGETSQDLTGDGDCGYVAFFTENEKIVQIGDPDEIDKEAVPKSQTLVSTTFDKVKGWWSVAQTKWNLNAANSSSIQTGSVGIGVASYDETEAIPSVTTTLLKATSTASAPTFHYTVKSKSVERTETTVKYIVTIDVGLGSSSSFFGKGYGLTASIYINNKWYNYTLKRPTERWRGTHVKTLNIHYTWAGISETATKSTDIRFKVTRTDNYGTAGTLAETKCADIIFPAHTSRTPESYYLTPFSYGTDSGWHGPSISRVIPADAAGDIGVTNFTFSYSHKYCITDVKQRGSFRAYIQAGGKAVAGVTIEKNADGKNANLRFTVNGSYVETMTVDVSSDNKYFNSSKTSTITKTGDTITFDIGGIKKTFRDADIKNVVSDNIAFYFRAYGTRTPVYYNGLQWAKFVKNYVEWKDIPNKFSAGDVVEADCKNGEIYLNGNLMPSLGALGNDWEEFVLNPGLNQIGVAHSEWLTGEYVPNFKVLYREVFL